MNAAGGTKPDRRFKTTNAVDPRDHLGLAYQAAWWACRKYGGDYEDWIGPAYIGLCAVARTFDPALGFKFSTLAVGSLRRLLEREQMRQLGAKMCSVTVDGVKRQRRTMLPVTSLSGPGAVQLDVGNSEIDTDGLCIEELGAMVAKLSPLHRHVVTSRSLGLTLDEIGADIGKCKERARQIEVLALEQLRRLYRNRGADITVPTGPQAARLSGRSSRGPSRSAPGLPRTA